MKTSKLKVQQNTEETIRAKILKADESVFKPLISKKQKNGNDDSWSYSSLNSMPAGLKQLCLEIFDDINEKDKIGAKVYPPGCTEKMRVGSMSDSVAIYMIGKQGVVRSEINPSLLEMAQINIPKDAALKTKEIFFHEKGSYFIDGYPFALVSDYVEMTGKVQLGGYKGGRSKYINIRQDRKDRWIFIFSKIAGKETLKKIAKTVKDMTGKDLEDVVKEDEDKPDERLASLADDL